MARTRGETLTQLREQEDSTRARAERTLYGLLYPAGHPYARPSVGSRETVEALSGEDCRGFHGEYYGAAGMKVSLAGALDPEPVRRKLESWFRGSSGPAPQPDWHMTPSGAAGQARIPMPHKSQVDIIMAGPGIPRHHPDYLALSLVNLILGSLGLMGRLGERVREQQGMAYSVSSRSVSRLWAGEWVASAGVAPENVERTIEAVLAEVREIRSEPVTEQELQDARDYLIGSVPLRMETSDGIAAYMLNAEYYDLGLDYITRYPGYILAETRETLRAAAERHMDPERLSTVMAGPL
jgi:zinc protease